MSRYLLKRFLLVIPTLLLIITLNFIVIQAAPGGPVDLLLQQNHRAQTGLALNNVSDAATREALIHEYGFDKPVLQRYWNLLSQYLRFDLGSSFTSGVPVATLIWQRLPVSLSLGLWSTLLVYLIALPLGIAKATLAGTKFDGSTTFLMLALYAAPSFLLASALALIFGGGGLFAWFPLLGLTSPGTASWAWPARLADYAWHLVLPVLAMAAGGIASLTFLTKNAILDELPKLYILAARARGLPERRVLYRHTLPNALLLILASLPATLTGILFSSALFVEIIFSLPGLGELGFQAVEARDYPVMFGTLYIYTLTGLILRILGDYLFTLLDPRIDFQRQT